MYGEIQNDGKRIRNTLMLLFVTGGLFLYNWTEESALTAHVMPATQWCDINGIVSDLQESRAYAEYDSNQKDEVVLLASQTGLSEKSVLTLIQQGRGQELLKLQEIYYAPVEVETIRTTPFTVSEWLTGECEEMPMADIQNGDILITKNSRVLGWRNGHAGLVVDAENGLVLEAVMPGCPSRLCRISKWESYPSYMVLRLKTEAADIAEAVASYARENLVGVPYQLLAGVLGEGTQCAHLVWYAYMQFDIDLDSDGGWFVTPDDIQNSPYLEVVQVYGY